MGCWPVILAQRASSKLSESLPPHKGRCPVMTPGLHIGTHRHTHSCPHVHTQHTNTKFRKSQDWVRASKSSLWKELQSLRTLFCTSWDSFFGSGRAESRGSQLPFWKVLLTPLESESEPVSLLSLFLSGIFFYGGPHVVGQRK